MYKHRFGLFLLSLLVLVGCTEKKDVDVLAELEEDYKVQIEELKKENENAENEYLKQLSDYSVYLQMADSTARKVMKLISENNFNQIETDYGVKTYTSDGKIAFKRDIDISVEGFPIEQASYPMFISDFTILSDTLEIGYFLDDLETNRRYLINVVLDKNGRFKDIQIGDV